METQFDKDIMNNPRQRALFEKEYNESLLCDVALEKAGVVEFKPFIPIVYTYEDIINGRFDPPDDELTPEQERAFDAAKEWAMKLARKAMRAVKSGARLSREEAERIFAAEIGEVSYYGNAV